MPFASMLMPLYSFYGKDIILRILSIGEILWDVVPVFVPLAGSCLRLADSLDVRGD